MAALFVARPGGAHTLGISTVDFTVEPGGRVDARLVFASAEPLGGLRLDRDGDGVVTADEVRASSPALAAFVDRGIAVTADGDPCPGSFGGAMLGEIDGLVITAEYACPPRPARIAAVLYYLADLGPRHREVARIVAGSATAEALLTREEREVALSVPAAATGSPAASGALLSWRRAPRLAALAAFVLAVLGAGGGLARRARARSRAVAHEKPRAPSPG